MNGLGRGLLDNRRPALLLNGNFRTHLSDFEKFNLTWVYLRTGLKPSEKDNVPHL